VFDIVILFVDVLICLKTRHKFLTDFKTIPNHARAITLAWTVDPVNGGTCEDFHDFSMVISFVFAFYFVFIFCVCDNAHQISGQRFPFKQTKFIKTLRSCGNFYKTAPNGKRKEKTSFPLRVLSSDKKEKKINFALKFVTQSLYKIYDSHEISPLEPVFQNENE
jgi:hypothetical protein